MNYRKMGETSKEHDNTAMNSPKLELRQQYQHKPSVLVLNPFSRTKAPNSLVEVTSPS